MKKLCALVVAFAVLFPCLAMAEIDLSGMNYDELVALKDQINLAIWNSQEWQEVEVPQGVWLVGEDIPAGHWNISAVGKYAMVTIGTHLDETGKDISAHASDFFEYEMVTNPTYKRYDKNSDLVSVDYDLKEGTYVLIEQGTVVFSPYFGKPSLGFK